MLVEANGNSYTYNFDKIKQDCKPLGSYQVSLSVSTEGITKEFRVLDPDNDQKPNMNILKLIGAQKKAVDPTKMEANCKLPGISISMIDESPKERILLTLFGLESKIDYETKLDDSEKYVETILGFELKINHMQIDNMFCRGAEFPVIMCPSKLLEEHEHEEGEEEEIPWF